MLNQNYTETKVFKLLLCSVSQSDDSMTSAILLFFTFCISLSKIKKYDMFHGFANKFIHIAFPSLNDPGNKYKVFNRIST